MRLLDRVRLVHDVQDRGFLMPAGSQGTVVHVYRGGEGLEVEFISPAHVLLSLDCTQVQPL